MKNRIVSFLLLFLFLSVLHTQVLAQSCGYAYKKEITIDHTQVSGNNNLEDFPMLISVTDNDLRTTGNGGRIENTNGYDITFVSENGEFIPHQIERYAADSGIFVAWVKVPVVYKDLDTKIEMYYGNASITANPSSVAVWDNDYQGVWHLHDDLNDGSSTGNDGTNSGSTDAKGKIAECQSFDGSNDYIFRTDANLNGNIPSLSSGSPDEFTISGWIQIDVLNARRPLMSKQGNGAGTDRGFVFMMEDDNRLKIELFKNNVSGDRTEVYSTATLTTGTWYYITVTYQFVTDGTSEAYLYIDGANDGSTTTSVGPIVTNTRDLDIGRYYWNGSTQYYQDGKIDEVRVSDVVRSAGWIATEYNNQNNPSSFYTIGAEQGGSFTPTVPVCGFNFKKVITIDSDSVKGSGSHTDFPVLITFTDTDLESVANGGGVESDNGYDIVFTDNSLNPLDHQIEEYDPTTGALSAWVKIPSLSTSADYEMFMMYGNADLTTDLSTSCAWSSDYQAVWHLHDDFLDAAGGANNGTNNGSTDNTGGVVGDCQSFDGTNDFVQLGVSGFGDIDDNQTVSIWAQFSAVPTGNHNFLSITNNSSTSAVQIGYRSSSSLAWQYGGGTLASSGGSESINTWHHYVYTYDGTTHRFYVDGQSPATSTTAAQTATPDDAELGRWTGGSEYFGGLLDEVRYSTDVKSDGWIATEYTNIANPSNFYSIGSEIVLNVTSTGSGDWDQTGIWNTGAVPSTGATVTILHEVDIDDRDEQICNLTVSNSNDNLASFDVQNGRTLEVQEDVRLESTSGSAVDVNLIVMNNNSKLIVNRNLILDQDNGDDIFMESQSAGDSIIVRGDMLLEHDGGDNMEIETDNATAVIQVAGDLIANMNSGTDDLLTFDLNAGTLNVLGSIIANRTSTFSDIHFNMDGGHVIADSMAFISNGGGGSDELRIEVDQTSTFTINNNFYMSMGGGDDHEIYINNNAGTAGVFTVNGNMVIDKTGGDDLKLYVDDADSEFHVVGDLTINSSGAEEVVLNLDNGDFTVDGDFYWNDTKAGADVIEADMDGGTLTVGDSLYINANGNGAMDFFIDMDGASTINAGYFVAELSGQGGNEEILIDIDNTSVINVTNNMLCQINTGNDFELHLGQNTTGSTAQLNVTGDLTLDHNGAVGADDIQFIINDDAVATVGGVFTMDTDGSAGGTGNFYTQLNDNGILNVGSNLVMDNTTGASYLQIQMNDNATLRLGGNVVRNASPNNFGLISSSSTTTTIEYNGTGAQIFADEDGAGTDEIEYELVVINNTFATEPQLTMEAPVTLDNSITFTDGVLQTTAVNLLSLADNATANIGSAASYVSGPFSKTGDDDFIFPLGNSGTWAPLGISNMINGPAATDVFSAEFFSAQHPQAFLDSNDYTGDNDDLFNTSIVEYWDLSRDNGSAEPQVTLYWGDNTASFITDTAELVVAHLTGATEWTNEGGAASGALAAGSVRSNTHISSFSVFTFGSTSSAVNPLPIELVAFNAEAVNQVVELTWKTASEIDNDYFTIERSNDARNFEEVIRVQGAGDSHQQLDYLATDEDPYNGTSYYRLKQTDFNGNFTYSEIRAVSFSANKELAVYPNPNETGELFFNQEVSGVIINSQGQLIQTVRQEVSVDVQAFPKGVYYLRTLNEAIKFIVR